MKYHVKWVNHPRALSFYESNVVGKEVVEDLNLGAFITGLINDSCVVIQCEPI